MSATQTIKFTLTINYEIDGEADDTVDRVGVDGLLSELDEYAIEQALKADGVNIAMNNREHAGQVVDHPHLHIIPRFKGDGLKLMPQRSYAENEAKPVAEKIRVAISAS